MKETKETKETKEMKEMKEMKITSCMLVCFFIFKSLSSKFLSNEQSP